MHPLREAERTTGGWLYVTSGRMPRTTGELLASYCHDSNTTASQVCHRISIARVFTGAADSLPGKAARALRPAEMSGQPGAIAPPISFDMCGITGTPCRVSPPYRLHLTVEVKSVSSHVAPVSAL